MKKNTTYRHIKQQQGLTMIDLLIGLFIGLLVVTAAIASVVFTRTAQTSQSDNARLQQQASLVMRLIGFQLKQAGAVEMVDFKDSGVNTGLVTYDTRYTGFGGVQNVNVSGVDGGGNAPDTLNVSAQDQQGTVNAAVTSTVRDCLGNAADLVGVRMENTFSVNVGQNSLMCTGSNAASGAQAIAVGVENFQVRYGVATGGSGNAQQIQYLSTVPSFNTATIRSVQVCLVLRGEQTNNSGGGSVVTDCNNNVIAADGRIRRVFTNTFYLRNSPEA